MKHFCYVCHKAVKEKDIFCEHCRIWLKWIEVCKNCGKEWISGDKYCRFCGAPLGSPSYILDEMMYMYGCEAMKRVHVCSACGYTWETVQGSDGEKYCPLCGGSAPIVSEEEPDHSMDYLDFQG